MTVYIFRSFIDTFAIDYYYQHAQSLFQGSYPYISYSYEYPIISWIPVLIAYIPALILKSESIFILSFMGLMIICDVITTICIYKITLTIWKSNKKALIAGILYATAIQVGYVTLSEYTAFVTMLLAIGLMYTISKKETINGYIGITFGYFSKAFPIITYPFVILYNSKKTSLKSEIITASKIFGISGLILFLPLYLINRTALDTYLFKINGESRSVFSSSVTYMVNAWTQGVFGLPITTNMISTVFLILLGIIMVSLLYISYKTKTQDPKLLLKIILVAIFAVVTSQQFHSPNYDVFYILPLCILAVDDIRGMILFYASQIIAYVVFPLSFYSLWTNPTYTGATGSMVWWIALILFTVQFIVLLGLVYLVVKPKEIMAMYNA